MRWNRMGQTMLRHSFTIIYVVLFTKRKRWSSFSFCFNSNFIQDGMGLDWIEMCTAAASASTLDFFFVMITTMIIIMWCDCDEMTMMNMNYGCLLIKKWLCCWELKVVDDDDDRIVILWYEQWNQKRKQICVLWHKGGYRIEWITGV